MKTVTCFTLLLLFIQKRWQQKQNRTQKIIKSLHQNELLFDFNTDNYLELEKSPSIGDTSCFYNARSPYLRCAISPMGNCANCQHYEKR